MPSIYYVDFANFNCKHKITIAEFVPCVSVEFISIAEKTTPNYQLYNKCSSLGNLLLFISGSE